MGNISSFTPGRKHTGLPGIICKTVLFTLFLGTASLLLFSVIAYRFPDPGKITPLMGYLSLSLTALLSGSFAAKKIQGGVLSGLITGCALALILFLLHLVFRIHSESYPFLLLFYLGFILLCGIGGWFSRPKVRKRKIHR